MQELTLMLDLLTLFENLNNANDINESGCEHMEYYLKTIGVLHEIQQQTFHA